MSLVSLILRVTGLHRLSGVGLLLLIVVLAVLAGVPANSSVVYLGLFFGLGYCLLANLRLRRKLRKLRARCSGLRGELEEVKLVKQRLAEDSRLKSEFLANVSHDLRTPMNGIMGFTALALETELSGEQKQYLESVLSCSESLLSLLNEILDFSKLEAGKLILDSVEFDVRELVESVADVIAPAAGRKGLEVVPMVSREVPVKVCGDPNRLRQVITNLAGNAAKFTTTGEVAINVGLISGPEDGVQLRFEIRDTGIGIPEAEQAKIFERFVQAKGSSAAKHGGTGLGLAICKRLVSLMRGEIGVESSPGVGSTFWFTARFGPAALTAEDGIQRAELSGLRVLVVDDNAAVRAALSQILQSCGCLARAVGGGEDPLALLEQAARAEKPYDVAVFDMSMPGLHREGIAKLVRKEAPFDQTSLVVMAPVGSTVEMQLLKSGRTEKLSKPAKHGQVRDVLLRLVRGGNRISGPQAPGSVIPTGGPKAAPCRGKVLLAEDNVVNQRLASRILEKAGYEVDIVETGRAAIEALADGSYSIVLMDVHMPDMDGLAATSAIRKLYDKNHQIPVIALTADARVEDRQRCLEAGMNDYISKPIKSDDLLAMVARWIQESEGQAAYAPSLSRTAEASAPK